MITELVMPWPPAELNPNKRVHWATRAKHTRNYRMACKLLVPKNQRYWFCHDGRIKLHLEFVPPDRRKRDEDNMIAAFKAGRDGIADALGVDDNRFRVTYEVSDSIGGMVRVSFI